MNHQTRLNRSPFQLGILFSLATVLAACALNSAEPLPTRTPAPTFTATAIPQDTPVDPAAVAATQVAVQTEQAAQPVQPAPVAQNTPVQEAATQPQAQQAVTTTQSTDTGQAAQPAVEPTATSAPPTPSPTSAKAQVIISSPANVRGGPATTYSIVGAATVGQQFDVLGKNPQGDWWQINFNGVTGWVFGQLVSPLNTGAVAVAQNIPAPPPPTPIPPTQPPPPPPTQPPAAPPAAQPTQPPAAPPPAAPPAAQPGGTKFKLGDSWKCEPNAGVTYFEGFVRYLDNSERNGVCVHVGFYGPRTTKCSGCDGVGNGKWGFSPFGGSPAPAGTPIEIFVVQCPASGMPLGGINDGFSDLTPLSPKWTRTIQASEQCSGITFYGND